MVGRVKFDDEYTPEHLKVVPAIVIDDTFEVW
jgi:hypothetical protein